MVVEFGRVKVMCIYSTTRCLLGVISSEMNGIPCSRDGFAGGRLESADSGFDYFGDHIWTFPIRPEFSVVQLLCVFENFAQYDIAQLERSRSDFLVVMALDLVLVVLNSEQCLVASFLDIVQRVEQQVNVELDVLQHF